MKEDNNKKNISKNDKKENFNFIMPILKNNIGNLVDDFLRKNIDNKITVYLADGFVRFIIESMEKTEKEVIEEIKKIKI